MNERENADAMEALRRWPIACRTVVSLESVAGGFSGSSVFCVRHHGEATWALKRWPQQVSPQRVAQVHRLQMTARQQGCYLVPQLAINDQGGTIVASNENIWELATWIDGVPLARDASPVQVARGAFAIAMFHQSLHDCGSMPRLRRSDKPDLPFEFGTDEIISPAVTARWERIQQLTSELRDVSSRPECLWPNAELTRAISEARALLRTRWEAFAAEALRKLEPWLRRPVHSEWILGDVHRDHIFFSGKTLFAGRTRLDSNMPQVDVPLAAEIPFVGADTLREASGLLDFDALRKDSPAADLARWGASFQASKSREPGDRAAYIGSLVAEYSKIRPFSDQDRRLAEQLVAVAPWINLGNWVCWLVLGTRIFQNNADTIASRISELVDSCDGLWD